ncbi:uncharacterized protein LOC134201318 [Bombyx mori]|uniref:uncharacterized protein LOC134201318 n=1 Tax=Bombyx mori TaxID=7091 RepID=UPI002ED3FCE9
MSEPCDGVGGVSLSDATFSKNSPEVGAPSSARPSGSVNKNMNTSVDGVPADFFTQMLQMMKHVSDRMTSQSDISKVRINDVFLPSYDPDANVGVREWCQHVTTAVETYNLSDYEVRMKAGSLLKGRARLWVDNWLVSTTTWQELHYRELNRNTVRDHYALPIISDQIDQLAGGIYFTTIDMAAGFHQIPISEGSIEKTAFVTPDGLYEYLTMPFGLCNAVSVYQRCINRALAHLTSSPDQVSQVYVDDVLSKCKDFDQGLYHIERILIALQEAGFSINVDKTAFFKRSIEYLGNIIADGQVSPSPRKVEALTKAPIPKTVKQVRQFNGLAGYFRRFIPNFSRVMAPLYELTKNDTTREWNERHDEARDYIVKHLSTAPTLTLFQEDAPIELYTDASSIGYGAVLVQTFAGRQHPVAYMSQRTTDAESRYHSYELETLAVVRAIKHFRHYLYGRKFKIEQHRDDVLRPVMESITSGDSIEGYVMEDGILKKMLTDPILGIHKPIVVPKSLQWSLINSFHVTLQHPGWEKTLQKLRETYWFDKMNSAVRRFVDNCVICRTSKGPSGSIQAQLHPIQKPTAAFQVIHMDITGKMGTRNSEGQDEYVIVAIDAFTKYILLSYSNDKSPSSTLAALKRVIHLFGTPVQVVVDGGREFLGEFKVYTDRIGIDVHSIAPGTSRANGQVERVMGTLKNALTMIKNYSTQDWRWKLYSSLSTARHIE